MWIAGFSNPHRSVWIIFDLCRISSHWVGGRGLSGHLCGVDWCEGGSLKLQPSRAVEGLPCLKLYGGHFMNSKLVGVRGEDLNRVKVKGP